ncbi:hypothetical protein R1flu_014165 [Riccia fluitans]|uniref:Uncharacterized protein n=1 Tax=Riccia fluitans TaxID=41844 RepID=A0ABD1YFB3_9MARC
MLSDLYKAYDNSDYVKQPEDAAEPVLKKKRAYKSVKRRKPDANAQKEKKLMQRASVLLSDKDIDDSLTKTTICRCGNECLRKVNRKDVITERHIFHVEQYRKRVEHILSKFNHPGFEKGKILFISNMVVCKPAFWTIYGFTKQSFYNYKQAYKMGMQIGFHENSGDYFILAN